MSKVLFPKTGQGPAKVANADDLIRDAEGFTHPNLHRRIDNDAHSISCYPVPGVEGNDFAFYSMYNCIEKYNKYVLVKVFGEYVLVLGYDVTYVTRAKYMWNGQVYYGDDIYEIKVYGNISSTPDRNCYVCYIDDNNKWRNYSSGDGSYLSSKLNGFCEWRGYIEKSSDFQVTDYEILYISDDVYSEDEKELVYNRGCQTTHVHSTYSLGISNVNSYRTTTIHYHDENSEKSEIP